MDKVIIIEGEYKGYEGRIFGISKKYVSVRIFMPCKTIQVEKNKIVILGG